MRTLISRLRRGWVALPALLLSGVMGGTAAAAEGNVSGAMIVRDGVDKPWRFVQQHKESLGEGTEIVGGLGATVNSPNGAVQARFAGDISGLSPFPILETAVILQKAADTDFALELSRGRIDLTNRKKAGPATIRLTVRDKSGVITLVEPGSRVVVEMYSRWPKGVPFTKKPKPTDAPALALIFIAVKGEVHLKGPQREFTLKAPPGPALLFLDGLTDSEPRVETLDQAPAWIDPDDAKLVKKAKHVVELLHEGEATTGSIDGALRKLAESDDESARRIAIILLGALDDLSGLAEVVRTTKHQDVVDNAIVVLRNWIGRAPGQDLKLYHGLIEKAHYQPYEAEQMLQLLHSFGEGALQKPETYQALINFLDCDRLAIRALANWHLVRLVPAGRQIGFNATADKQERDKAVAKWKELVPEGTVPGQEKR